MQVSTCHLLFQFLIILVACVGILSVLLHEKVSEPPPLPQLSSWFKLRKRYFNWATTTSVDQVDAWERRVQTSYQGQTVRISLSDAHWYDPVVHGGAQSDGVVPSCPVKCLWVLPPDPEAEIHLRVFRGYDTFTPQERNHTTAFLDIESEYYHTDQKDAAFRLRERFDWFVGYNMRGEADVPLSYLEFSEAELRAFVGPPFNERKAKMASITSNCEPMHRNLWISRLGRLGILDAMGRCGRTTTIAEQTPQCESLVGNMDQSICIYRSYQFVMAFENTINSIDYLSEKVYSPMIAGAIPVVYGPPNEKMMLPPDAAIFARDYATPVALAAHLRKVSADPVFQAKYFKWKLEPWAGEWLMKLKFAMKRLGCNLCMRYVAEKNGIGFQENFTPGEYTE